MKSVLGGNEKPNCLVIDEIDGAPAVSLNSPSKLCVLSLFYLLILMSFMIINSYINFVFKIYIVLRKVDIIYFHLFTEIVLCSSYNSQL